MPLEISPSKVGSITLVNLRGTIVAGNDRGMLHDQMQELLEAGGTNFILDLGQVTYVDSTGIGALIEALNLVVRKGGCVKLLHLTKRIHDVLQIARLALKPGVHCEHFRRPGKFWRKRRIHPGRQSWSRLYGRLSGRRVRGSSGGKSYFLILDEADYPRDNTLCCQFRMLGEKFSIQV